MLFLFINRKFFAAKENSEEFGELRASNSDKSGAFYFLLPKGT